MSEPAYTEVQLSSKQLVFWFMTALAVLVATFLLGVSVGRGVRNANADTVVDLGDAPPSGVTASTTPTPSPTDLTFHDMLQGKSPAASPKPEPPTPAPDAPPTAGAVPPAAGNNTGTSASKSGKADAAPAKPTATPTPPPKTTPAATPAVAVWTLQIGAYKSKENADNQVASFKAKGYPAFVFANPAGLYYVRIGQFAARAEAAAMQKKLASEGTKSSITR